jgi:hypothetical protein
MTEQYCLRCKTVTLAEVERLEGQITFFECPVCRRHYAQAPGKPLTFRWLNPISIVLYNVIFDHTPTKCAADIAAKFIQQRTPHQLGLIVKEIRLELEDPTQQVRDILDCEAPERELREFLRLFLLPVEQYLANLSTGRQETHPP